MRVPSFVLVAGLAASLAASSLVACKDKEVPSSTTVSAPSAAVPSATAVATTAPAAASPSPAALGLKPGEERAASCDTISADGECGEVLATDSGQKATAAKAMKMMCDKGTVAAACPTNDIVLSCRVGKDMLIHYYGHGGKTYDAAKAKAACENGRGHPVGG